MLILSVSDIHGTTQYLEDLKNAVKKHGVDVLVCTGDLLRWGPRMEEWRSSRAEKRPPQYYRENILESEEEDEKFTLHFYKEVDSLGIPVVTIPGWSSI